MRGEILLALTPPIDTLSATKYLYIISLSTLRMIKNSKKYTSRSAGITREIYTNNYMLFDGYQLCCSGSQPRSA